MALQPTRRGVAIFATCLLIHFHAALGQAADRLGKTTPSDRAAGQWVDSLFDKQLPVAALSNRATQAGTSSPPARSRPPVEGKLVANTNQENGAPPFAIVDRYGGVLRYVEPSEKVDATAHLGEQVVVRRDTGDILLASQLVFTGRQAAPVLPTVRQAAFQEPIEAGEASVVKGPIEREAEDLDSIYQDSMPRDDMAYSDDMVYLDGGTMFGDCAECQVGGYPGFDQALVRPRPRAYVRGEYLLWWFNGMDAPPLVTVSAPETVNDDRGVLPNYPGDNSTTQIVYGGQELIESDRHGFRIQFGVWLDNEGRQAIEADYFDFGNEGEVFVLGGVNSVTTGTGVAQVISRPFFDLFPDADRDGVIDVGVDSNGMALNGPREAAELVSSSTLDGQVAVRTTSDFQSAGIRLRHTLCQSGCAGVLGCGDCVGCGDLVDCGSACGGWGTARHVDLLLGFRYARLKERLNIREDLTTNNPMDADDDLPPDDTGFILIDDFSTVNEFLGTELGFVWGLERNRWSFELLSKLGLGNIKQRVTIDGSNTISVPGAASTTTAGGLLTHTDTVNGETVGNIGTYERDDFSVMPELGLTWGYKVTPRLRLTAGYTLLYLSNVVRPGDQIDYEVNGSQLPSVDNTGAIIPASPASVIPIRPQFSFVETDFWGQGLNFGADYRW